MSQFLLNFSRYFSEQIAERLFNQIIEHSAFQNNAGRSFMSHSMTPGEIERGQEHGEKEPVTNKAGYNGPPPFTHSSNSCP